MRQLRGGRDAIEGVLRRRLAKSRRRRRHPLLVTEHPCVLVTGHRLEARNRRARPGPHQSRPAPAEYALQVVETRRSAGRHQPRGHHRRGGSATEERQEIALRRHGRHGRRSARRRERVRRRARVRRRVLRAGEAREVAAQARPPRARRFGEPLPRGWSEEVDERRVQVVVGVGPHHPPDRERPVPQRAEHRG